jgi:hypothetical protein
MNMFFTHNMIIASYKHLNVNKTNKIIVCKQETFLLEQQHCL